MPGVVTNFMAEPVITSVLLTWSPPQEPNGVIIVYEVTYRINSSDLVVVNTTDMAFTLSLTLSTEVSDISVRAYTSVGPGDDSLHFNVSTPKIPNPREFQYCILCEC